MPAFQAWFLFYSEGNAWGRAGNFWCFTLYTPRLLPRLAWVGADHVLLRRIFL